MWRPHMDASLANIWPSWGACTWTPPDAWATRLERLIRSLEHRCDPTVVLLESRSGLHDIAATAVTDLNAQVLLFATDSASTWLDYEILFHHWYSHGLAASIRERLSIVSALTPEIDTGDYLEGFRERSWNLFQEHLYDELGADEDPPPPIALRLT